MHVNMLSQKWERILNGYDLVENCSFTSFSSNNAEQSLYSNV